MRHHYRVTKYDPSLRGEDGSFQGETWTAYSDVGRNFNGVELVESDYLRVEAAYLFAIEALLSEARVDRLVLRGLENRRATKLPKIFRTGAKLNVAQCVEFASFALREQAWGKLVDPVRAYVHFGYDYYMYLGVPARCPAAIAEVQRRGLFVEEFRSPYRRSAAAATTAALSVLVANAL